MPNKITNVLNQLIADAWTAIDANDNSFLAIDIKQNDRGLEIWGIEFGVRAAAVDEDLLRTACIVSESFSLDPNGTSIIQRGRMFNGIVRFFDAPTAGEKSRVHSFTKPIKIESGKSVTILFNTFQNGGAIGGIATVYLTVHGNFVTDDMLSFYSNPR